MCALSGLAGWYAWIGRDAPASSPWRDVAGDFLPWSPWTDVGTVNQSIKVMKFTCNIKKMKYCSNNEKKKNEISEI
jgi:hypothetical protein